LKAPATARRLGGQYGRGWFFSSHADQHISAWR
jgi:hypothetical protein